MKFELDTTDGRARRSRLVLIAAWLKRQPLCPLVPAAP